MRVKMSKIGDFMWLLALGIMILYLAVVWLGVSSPGFNKLLYVYEEYTRGTGQANFRPVCDTDPEIGMWYEFSSQLAVRMTDEEYQEYCR